MSSPLEKFVQENKNQFDSELPDSRIWEKISDKMSPEQGKGARVRSLPFRRWLVAAAAVVFLGVTIVIYYSRYQGKAPAALAGTKEIQTDTGNQHPVASLPVDTALRTVTKDIPAPLTAKQNNSEPAKNTDPGESKEMFYYAKLIELKHEELKTLEKDEPLLYKQFAGDVQKLDSVYHSLKTQLPSNSNREQVIEAMISNLQLQIALLNKQLKIIKQIKHSKKSAYEKAYQSV